MKYDLIVDVEELEETMKDEEVNIKIKNAKSTSFQFSLVSFLLSLTNMISPVKFNVVFE